MREGKERFKKTWSPAPPCWLLAEDAILSDRQNSLARIEMPHV